MKPSYSTLKIRQSLKTLGFSDNEIKVLLFLFRHKKATARDISRDTMISFSSTQYALSSIVSRGLAILLPTGEDLFEIVSEKVFWEWVDRQQQEHRGIYEEAKQDIVKFFSQVEDNSWKPDVTYYEGADGIRDIYEDMLETGEDIYCWTDLTQIYDVLGDYAETFAKRRVEKGMKTYTIKPKKNVPNNPFANDPTRKDREMKLLADFPIDGEIRIYGDKVAIIQLNSDRPVGFIFEGRWIRDLFESVFQSAWKH
jgi:sugar-specific transcriptional regulator TrmB